MQAPSSGGCIIEPDCPVYFITAVNQIPVQNWRFIGYAVSVGRLTPYRLVITLTRQRNLKSALHVHHKQCSARLDQLDNCSRDLIPKNAASKTCSKG